MAVTATITNVTLRDGRITVTVEFASGQYEERHDFHYDETDKTLSVQKIKDSITAYKTAAAARKALLLSIKQLEGTTV